jgi:translation initiation factor 1
MAAKNKKVTGIVYSTNPDFVYQTNDPVEQQTLPPSKQSLRVVLDSKLKAGKKATLVTGFIGSDAELAVLAKKLKNFCAAGGSSADGIILVQGDFRQKIYDWLVKEGYRVKM